MEDELTCNCDFCCKDLAVDLCGDFCSENCVNLCDVTCFMCFSSCSNSSEKAQVRNGTNVPGPAHSYVPPPIQTQPYRSVERNVIAEPSAPSITEIVITDMANEYNKPRPEDDLPPSYEEALSASKTSLTHSSSSSRSNLVNTLNAPSANDLRNMPSAPISDSQPPPPSFEALQVNNRS